MFDSVLRAPSTIHLSKGKSEKIYILKCINYAKEESLYNWHRNVLVCASTLRDKFRPWSCHLLYRGERSGQPRQHYFSCFFLPACAKTTTCTWFTVFVVFVFLIVIKFQRYVITLLVGITLTIRVDRRKHQSSTYHHSLIACIGGILFFFRQCKGRWAIPAKTSTGRRYASKMSKVSYYILGKQ